MTEKEKEEEKGRSRFSYNLRLEFFLNTDNKLRTIEDDFNTLIDNFIAEHSYNDEDADQHSSVSSLGADE